MSSLYPNQQSFLQNILPLPLPIPRATQIQQKEGNKRLALWFPIVEYHMADPKLEKVLLWINTL